MQPLTRLQVLLLAGGLGFIASDCLPPGATAGSLAYGQPCATPADCACPGGSCAGGSADCPARSPAARGESGGPGWLPPDAGVSLSEAFERKAASFLLDGVVDIDLDDTRAVFAHVFSALPPHVDVLPTENYLYWQFHTPTKHIWGNLRLGPEDRDDGVIHIGYYEFREDLTGPEDANVRYAQLGPEDGVAITRIDDFEYDVTFSGQTDSSCTVDASVEATEDLEPKVSRPGESAPEKTAVAGRTIRFALNRVRQGLPRAFELPDDEVFVFRTHDEANLQFHLLFHTRMKNFMFVLNEDDGPLDGVWMVGDRLALDIGSGFLFYIDEQRNDRKILIGVYRPNVLVNNYYDGPADQLSDNYIKDVPEYKSYLHAAYPFTRGVIDQYGFYIHDPGNRVAVAPYYTYNTVSEMAGMVETCSGFGGVGEMMACLIPGGIRSESDTLATGFGPLPGLAALPGLMALAGTQEAEVAQALPLDIFYEDWEGPDPLGAAGWTATGLWHLIKDPPAQCPPTPVFYSAITSAYYGIDSTCTYNDGQRNFGYLTSPVIHNVPPHAYLHFWHRRRTENTVDRDISEVHISVDGGPFMLLREILDESDIWIPSGPISLRGYAPGDIQIRFVFDTVDDIDNDFTGWMVDDIRITVSPAVGGAPSLPWRHMAGATWHVAQVTFPPPPNDHEAGTTWHVVGQTFVPGHQLPASPLPPSPKHAAGITWHLPGITFIPGDARHNTGFTWHVGGQTFIPPGTKHAAMITWHIPNATFVPAGARHNTGVTWHVAGQTFIPPGTRHAALITWHVPSATFVPGDAKHNTGVTWHVGGVTFIPSTARHAARITWHIPDATFIPQGAKHNTGFTWHVGGQTFIPPGSKHAALITWHIPNATFVPAGAKHNTGFTWHVSGQTFIPPGTKHAALITWHIPNATFVPGTARHNTGATWHVNDVTFIPGTARHAARITWHIGGATFVPGDAKHNTGVTWHVNDVTFIPGTARHAALITWHLPDITFVPGTAKHNTGVTWHVADQTFIPADARHAALITWHIPDATFVPGTARHNTGWTWHVNDVTFIPGDSRHAALITWHIGGATFVPRNAKHMSGVTWHQAEATFLMRVTAAAEELFACTGPGCEPIECHEQVCNEVDGLCEWMPTPGAPCGDGGADTGGVCDPFGSCIIDWPPVPCDDGNPCTFNDVRGPDGVCAGEPVPAGTPCDGGRCTIPGTGFCDGEGRCQSQIMVGAPCDDGDPATTHSVCDETGGCYGVDVAPCDDGSPCGPPQAWDFREGCITIGPGPQCFDLCAGEFGVCDEEAGCLWEDPPICDQADDCFIGECDPAAGGCIAQMVDCDDGNPCTQTFCADNGVCVSVTLADGDPCDDGKLCTVNNFCLEGACVGDPVKCDDCHLCDPDTGGCDLILCAPDCPVPFADADLDGDVDMDDFGAFQRCYDPDGVAPGCECWDRNLDGVIDDMDLEAFVRCATGPGVPLDPDNPPPGCIP